MSEQKFLADVEELLEKHPEVSKNFLVKHNASTPHVTSAGFGTQRCIKWGQSAKTGQWYCLEWEDSSSSDSVHGQSKVD